MPVRSSVARDHEAVDGDTAKVADVKSSLNMGEANVTALASKDVGARNRRSPVVYVFVMSTDRKPLHPCRAAYARKLLRDGKAAVFRRFPFTIILKTNKGENDKGEKCQLKIDPGSKVTGIAVVQGEKVVYAEELEHRGKRISMRLTERKALRRSRRNRKTRYRKARFLNRKTEKGHLPPSLEHRILTTLTRINRIIKLCPISGISIETAKFDTQKMENPEISGVEYQQGTLEGYDVREYLLEKWGRKCAYCDTENVPFQVDHIHPKSRGGSSRISNLTLACDDCNKKKGNQTVEEFLRDKPETLKKIKEQIKKPLDDALAMNATRWALYNRIKDLGLPVECGIGSRTKFNRTRLGLPKTHWLDAACVGASTPNRLFPCGSILQVKAIGHGNRNACYTDKFGFPSRHRTRQKMHFGFQTGDIVRATVPKGKHLGIHTGYVSCRAIGSFDIKTKTGKVAGISHKYCRQTYRSDGYAYTLEAALPPHA